MTSKFIPPKHPTKREKSDTPIEAPQLPQDLKKMTEAIEAYEIACNLFNSGMFHVRHHSAVEITFNFFKKVHEQMVEEALKHPSATMVDGLNAILEERKGVKDGATKGE